MTESRRLTTSAQATAVRRSFAKAEACALHTDVDDLYYSHL